MLLQMAGLISQVVPDVARQPLGRSPCRLTLIMAVAYPVILV